MSFRPLEIDGRFAHPPDARVRFGARELTARTGEPLSITLLAHGIYALGRSGKYHRPRGLFCGRGSCGNCLARLDGEANARLCLEPAHDGQRLAAQNVLGSARFDLLQAIDWLFPHGLDHHHLMVQSTLLNDVTVRVARQLAGLGKLPDAEVADVQVEARSVDVAVVGGGPAGLAVAAAARDRKLSTVVFDLRDRGHPGVIGGAAVLGLYDDRELLVAARRQLYRITATTLVLATGAHELPPACPGNDLPGVIALRAAEEALELGVLPGRQLVVALEPEADPSLVRRAARLAVQAREAGASVEATCGPLSVPGVPAAAALAAVEGTQRVRGARPQGEAAAIPCDALVWCGRTAPAYELARQLGLKAPFDARRGAFVPVCDADGRTERPGVLIAGEAAGVAPEEAASHGARVGAALVRERREAESAPAYERSLS